MSETLSQMVELDGVDDLVVLLTALSELAAERTVLYVEGTNMAPEVRAFLEARSVPATMPIKRGTIWPRPKTFHVQLTAANLAGLRTLAEHRADPEICDHLVVYRDDQLLLEAHDVGDNPIWVAADLAPDTLAGLRRALGQG